jgi:hypothetical protein
MKETAALSDNGRSEGGRMCWEVRIGGEGWGYWRDDIPAGLHGRSGALEGFVAVYSSNVTRFEASHAAKCPAYCQ